MQRHVYLAIFAVLIGCGDDGTKVNVAQPIQGDPVARASGDDSGEEAGDVAYEEDGEVLAAEDEGNGAPAAPCEVNFTKDLMPKLVATCGTSACHKDTTEPLVDDVTPQITYESLRDFGFDDEAWSDPHPTDSKLSEPALAAAVAGWRKCGAPFE